MFRIPAFYKFEMSVADATKVMTTYGQGDLLKGMKLLDEVWDDHASGYQSFDTDSDFYENYEDEVNAYNVIFSEMGALV